MISAYNSAVSALQTFATKLHSNSNNIANANTNDFKKTRVINSTVEPTGVKALAQNVDAAGPTAFAARGGTDLVKRSNVDLGVEIPDMKLNSSMYKANLKTLETVNEMTGELLKLKA